jgi:Rod binding domain-containing protein
LQEFEHFFVYTLLKEMGKSPFPDTLFGDSVQKRLAQDMLHDAWAGLVAQHGNLGIAAQIRKQLDVNSSVPFAVSHAANNVLSPSKGAAVPKIPHSTPRFTQVNTRIADNPLG